MARFKLYIGCALTHAPSEFIDSLEKFKQSLRSEGYQILDFFGVHAAGTPKDIYRHDILQSARKCDAFIGICDYPSTGLGYEFSEAVRLGVPVLALAHTDAKVTRLIQGASQVEPNVDFVRYKNLDKNALSIVNAWLKANKLLT